MQTLSNTINIKERYIKIPRKMKQNVTLNNAILRSCLFKNKQACKSSVFRIPQKLKFCLEDIFLQILCLASVLI